MDSVSLRGRLGAVPHVYSCGRSVPLYTLYSLIKIFRPTPCRRKALSTTSNPCRSTSGSRRPTQ